MLADAIVAAEPVVRSGDDHTPHQSTAARARDRDFNPSASMRRWLLPVLSVALFVAALYVIHDELARLHLRDVVKHLQQIPAWSVWAAAGLTTASYWMLGFYDVLALRYARKRVPYARALFVSFIAYAFGHNLSLAAFTGAAVRYRLYSSLGLTAADVATVTAFSTVTTGVGLAILAGVALLVEPAEFAAMLHVQRTWAQAGGSLLLAAVGGYCAWGLFSSKRLKIRGWSLGRPGARILLPQLALAVCDLSLSAAALWVLLPAGTNVSIAMFVGIYAVAIIAGLASHVPGGLGVFEAVILLGMPQARPEALVGSLLAYRALYYLAPLLIGALVFAAQELRTHSTRLAFAERAAAAYISPIVPQIAGALAFIAGALLLISGATPALDARLALLPHVLPLPVLELSHLAGSIVGLGLIILSRSLFQRVSAAYHASFWLLLAGIGASLLRGLDFEEAAILGVVLAVLWLGRRAFYRPSSIFDQRFTPAWIASIAIVLIAMVWIGFLAHRHVEYSNHLWWTFAIAGDAPRMLRASLVVVLLAAGYVVANLFRPARPAPGAATAADLERAKRILELEDRTIGQVALAGDKRLLFADGGDGFLMYQVSGRSWIALGDPVGRRSCGEELVQTFRELSDRYGGRCVFYQASGDRLPLYVDLGLAPLKLGEEARVSLGQFTLEGSARAELRQAKRRAERAGLTFEILSPPCAMQHMVELSRISNAWLAAKSTAEKHFSVGSFSEEYLRHFPIAVVRYAGSIVAFANLWASASHEELSIDLMRFGPDAPNGVMDYLFVELMLWGRAQGYRWFNLGMAPLSGLGMRRLAPAWHRLGSFVYRHAEHFYNFGGLRRYKSKFDPVWEPKYLASPGGVALPQVLVDVSVLIAGGLREVLTK